MKYKPLDDTKNEIRVLQFLNISESHSSQEPIQCSIENVPLEEPQHIEKFHKQLKNQQHRIWWDSFTKDVDLRESTLEQTTLDRSISLGLIQNHNHPGAFRYTWGDFEALSYTWGDGNETGMILLNGICKQVSINLEEALRTLRGLQETRLGMRYWVDSLCIDQENLVERNHQVKRMRDIYSRARAVIVWLGREEKADKDAVQTMRRLCRNPCIEYPLLLPPNLLLDAWHSLSAFMGKPYWNRSWIIQELALNHNSTLVLCGKLKLTRRMIRLGAMLCQQFSQASEDDSYRSIHYLEPDVWSTASHMYRLVSLTSDTHLRQSLDKLLSLVRRANATDKKDKVYGILGLLDDTISSGVIPDYSLSEQQVYTKFMISLISATQRLEQIIYGGISVEEGWPSWVPDWRLPFERHHVRYLRNSQASAKLPARIRFSRNGENNLLTCSGFTVDMVDGIGAHPSLSSGFARPNTPSTRYGSNLYKALCLTLLMDHPKATKNSSLLDVSWRTNLDSITSHANLHPRSEWAKHSNTSYLRRFHEFREANEKFRIGNQSFRDFFPQSGGKGIDNANIVRDMRLAVLSLEGRTLITTTTGYLGLAPKAVRQGDVIAILPGCGCPIIFRPCGSLYNVLGECYIHGLMNGEFFELENKENTLQQEFTLC